MGGMALIDKNPATGLNAAVAEELRAERAAQRVKIAAIADQTGISNRTLIRMLHAERHISVEALVAIAGTLGLTASDVISAAERRMTRAAADPAS